MKITVLGCGRWGSFITWYLSKNGHEVTEWGREDGKSYRVLKETGKNDYVTLNKNVVLTSDLKSALSGAELVVISVLSQSLRELLSCAMNEGLKGKKVVLCMKGLEEATGKRLSEIAKECGVDGQNLAIWVGPGHIEEFLKGKPNLMVIDSENRELTRFIADGLRSNLIRFYYGDDLLGNEVGAAAKNVMGIAAGMLDGSGNTTLKVVRSFPAPSARLASRILSGTSERLCSVLRITVGRKSAQALCRPHATNTRIPALSRKTPCRKARTQSRESPQAYPRKAARFSRICCSFSRTRSSKSPRPRQGAKQLAAQVPQA